MSGSSPVSEVTGKPIDPNATFHNSSMLADTNDSFGLRRKFEKENVKIDAADGGGVNARGNEGTGRNTSTAARNERDVVLNEIWDPDSRLAKVVRSENCRMVETNDVAGLTDRENDRKERAGKIATKNNEPGKGRKNDSSPSPSSPESSDNEDSSDSPDDSSEPENGF